MVEVRGRERLLLEAYTLWDFPSQGYGEGPKGDPAFRGVTPALAIWNLVRRYSKPGDLVVDVMAGSGTLLDVCSGEGRRALGFDLNPVRRDVLRADARLLPLPDDSVDLHILDSPHGDNLWYSEVKFCVGRLAAESSDFFSSLDTIAKEVQRTLKPGGVVAWIISDQYRHGGFTPVGFGLFEVLKRRFQPVDILCLVRRNGHTDIPEWEHRARAGNFYLRGFKYILVFRKGWSG
jgi:SAM-dependent methyltransferase